MLTTAACWRECTRCFCFASPFNFTFTWAMGRTMHINSRPVKCSRNVASPDLAGDKKCELADQWRQSGLHLVGHARTSGTCAHPVQNNGVVRNERRQSWANCHSEMYGPRAHGWTRLLLELSMWKVKRKLTLRQLS